MAGFSQPCGAAAGDLATERAARPRHPIAWYGPVEAPRHDADDGHRRLVDGERRAEDGRGFAEPSPEVVAQDHDRGAPAASSAASNVRPIQGRVPRTVNIDAVTHSTSICSDLHVR